jgi:succinate-acetate transporter protein
MAALRGYAVGMTVNGDVRVMLRPYASPLPLGFFSFAVGMALLAGLGFGWFSSPQEIRAAGVLMAVFVFPLELLATVVALVTRDTGAATTLGLYSTSWVALGLLNALDPTQPTSPVIGVYLLAFSIVLVPLAVSAAFGKVLLTVVLASSIVRAVFQGVSELGAPHWTKTADGVSALVVLALACYAGTAFLVEDIRKEPTPLVPRRGSAAIADPAADGVPEPGVRDQL